ncbi:MAG: bifunctional precorrin-2 dehydrogenase/sirohydrochlorin ferrochelatase [Actinomycetota bacterium]
MTDRYMVALVLDERPCLVVGGGRVATGKTENLLACGAQVTVVAPRATRRIQELSEQGRIGWKKRVFQESDLEGRFLVVASTDDTELHERIARMAEERGMLCNIVDVPALCNFTVPAVHREGPVSVAVSTAGTSPTLAKRLRDLIAAQATGFGRLAERLGQERDWSQRELSDYQQRQRFFESIVCGDPDPVDLVRRGDMAALEELIQTRRREASQRREDD